MEQARVLVQELQCCSLSVAWEVERRVLETGGGRMFPGDLRRRLRRTVLAVRTLLEPEELAQVEADAHADRRVSRSVQPDGMESLWALLPAPAARRHHAALEELVRLEAEADRARGVERTTDQRRADVLASLPGRVLAQLRVESAGAAVERDPEQMPDTAGDAVATEGASAPVAAPACSHGSATEIIVLMPFATLMGWSSAPAELQATVRSVPRRPWRWSRTPGCAWPRSTPRAASHCTWRRGPAGPDRT